MTFWVKVLQERADEGGFIPAPLLVSHPSLQNTRTAALFPRAVEMSQRHAQKVQAAFYFWTIYFCLPKDNTSNLPYFLPLFFFCQTKLEINFCSGNRLPNAYSGRGSSSFVLEVAD